METSERIRFMGYSKIKVRLSNKNNFNFSKIRG